MWLDLSKWTKGVKTRVSHINVHQRENLVEDSSNQRDRMTHYMDSQPFPPAILVIAQWAHEQSGYGGRNRV